MSLVSLQFMLFVTIAVFLYYVLPQKMQWKFLLLLSTLFYLSFNPKMSIYLIASICINYISSNKIEKLSAKEDKKKRKSVLVTALVLNFGILGLVKYTDFILGNISGIFSMLKIPAAIPAIEILAPLGISFYTFQATGYLLDVYWKRQKAETNIFKLALFTSYFPQMIQGPISKYGQLGEQFHEQHKFNYENITLALQLILWGYFKKMVIADNAAIAVNTVFGKPEEAYGITVIVGVLCYCMQLYADFSGGIDVIRGISQLFDIHLEDNFRRPFFSKSISEFWRRWHISLGVWMKDYVFYPFSLSKAMAKFGKFSKKHFGRTVGRKLPICLGNLLVFFLVGVWHGPSWHFIVYGMYNGMIIAVSSLLEPTYKKLYEITKVNKNSRGMEIFQIFRTFLLVNLGWYFDNTANLKDSFVLMRNTFIWEKIEFTGGTYLGLSVFQYGIIFLGCIVLFVIEILQEKGMPIRKSIGRLPRLLRWTIWIVLIYAIPILGHYSQGAGGFMYAQF